MLYQIILCAVHVDLEEYYANFWNTAIQYFEIKTSRCTRESGSTLDLFCIHKFYASGGMRDEDFKDDACGAKWSNEELCTFFRRTTLFQSCPCILHYQTTWNTGCSPIIKRRTTLILFKRWDMGDDGSHRYIYWRGSSGPCKSALFFYNLITPPPITLWLSYTYVAPAIIGRKLNKREKRIAKIKVKTELILYY